MDLKFSCSAPEGWSSRVDTTRNGHQYLSITRDMDSGDEYGSEIALSIFWIDDSCTSLAYLSQQRINLIRGLSDSVELRRSEYINVHSPEVYGHEIRFIVEAGSDDYFPIVQSEIFMSDSALYNRIWSFTLTALESVFKDCVRDFKLFVESIIA